MALIYNKRTPSCPYEVEIEEKEEVREKAKPIERDAESLKVAEPYQKYVKKPEDKKVGTGKSKLAEKYRKYDIK